MSRWDWWLIDVKMAVSHIDLRWNHISLVMNKNGRDIFERLLTSLLGVCQLRFLSMHPLKFPLIDSIRVSQFSGGGRLNHFSSFSRCANQACISAATGCLPLLGENLRLARVSTFSDCGHRCLSKSWGRRETRPGWIDGISSQQEHLKHIVLWGSQIT